MILLIDIGNSRIKWALISEDDWQGGEPLVRGNRAFKDIARPAWKELEPPQRVIVACVAGDDYAKSVKTWIKRRWKIDAEFMQAEAQCCGVINAYQDPERLGVDRWACLIAAHGLYDVPVCIADCGTAITIDALATDGKHLGGLIVPGLDLMVSSLSSETPGIELNKDNQQDVSLLGRNTESAVQGGTLYTAVALLDRVYNDIAHELGQSTVRIITGGDASRILPLLGTQPEHEPDLVLKGLQIFADETACAT
jgi:type III pantothenate kinase